MNTTYIKNDRFSRMTLEYMAQAKNFFVGIWESAYEFFTSYRWREMLFDLKTVSIIISLIFLGLIIFLLFKMNARGKVLRAIQSGNDFSAGSEKKKITKKWEKVEAEISADSPENYKLAVLEANDIFDGVMRVIGKAAEIRIINIEEIEQAKTIKNKIIENVNLELSKEEALRIVRAYRAGLTDLKIF